MRYLHLFLLLILTGNLSPLSAQENITLSGYVTDAQSSERLVGATLCDSTRQHCTISNSYGFFSLILPPGTHHIRVSYTGYAPELYTIDCRHDSSLSFVLHPNLYLEEIIITSGEENRVQSSEIPGLKVLPMSLIRDLPVVMGEKDILKTLQLMPGVQSGGEGSTSLYVRGGEADHNLILLDGVEVFNPDHLFGFFSFFNEDAVKSVRMYTSGFPAQYGGRLASVVDIRTKDGNSQEFRAKASVGLVSSKIQIEGPLVKERLTFIASARRTYLDLLAKPLINRHTQYSDASYFFYDLNGRIRWKPGPRSSLYISSYHGKDKGRFETDEQSGFDPPDDTLSTYSHTLHHESAEWGNTILTARYEQAISGRLFMNVALGLSQYAYRGENRQNDLAVFWYNDTLRRIDNHNQLHTLSSVGMQTLSVDFDHYMSASNRFMYGASATFHTISSSVGKSTSDNNRLSQNYPTQQYALFVQNEYKPTKKLSLRPGLRSVWYAAESMGQLSFEKRLSVNWQPASRLRLTAGYAEMTQYLSLLRFSGINLGSDLWLPAHATLKPIRSSDISAGLEFKLKPGLNMSLEAYIRQYRHLLAYKEGVWGQAQSNAFSELLTSGSGTARGIEVCLEKSTGRLTGLLSYCYSGSWRHFAGLNQGQRFKSRYDRPHSMRLLLTQTIGKRWSVSAVYTLMSGSLQTIGYELYGSVFDFSLSTSPNVASQMLSITDNRINGYRLPVYHRLDVSASYTVSHRQFRSSLSMGFYNAYDAQNAYEMQSRITYLYEAAKLELRKRVLFPIIPFLTYSIEF